MASMVITTTRTTTPDAAALLTALRAALANDATVGVVAVTDPMIYRVKRSGDVEFDASETTAATTAIEAAPSLTPQRDAQNQIDQLPIAWKAIALTLLDQLNVLRARAGLAEVTVQQALSAIRTKAGQL